MDQKIHLLYLNVKPENEMRSSAFNYWMAFNEKDVLEYI